MRQHLGASIIGNECSRKIWYSFRFCSTVELSLEQKIIFAIGKTVEEVIVKELGITDTQRPVFVAEHFGGSIDGILDGKIVEIKTHAKFNGQIPTGHIAQMQVYMGGLGIKKAIYIAWDKSANKLHQIEVEFDEERFANLCAKASMIIDSEFPPQKFESHKCNMCEFRPLCFEHKLPPVNCRTCKMSSVSSGTVWRCEKLEKQIPDNKQSQSFKCHEYIPELVSFAEYNGSEYTYDGKTFKNGTGGYSSEELRVMPIELINNPETDKIREIFDGKFV